VITITIQLLIIATSNHNFVNLITILLCLFLLDDQIVKRFTPSRIHHRLTITTQGLLTRPRRFVQSTASLLVLSVSLLLFLKLFVGVPLYTPFQYYTQLGSRYGIGHVYHIFPNMQTERHELQIEGSYDGITWLPYRFIYKPDVLNEPPAIHIPHDPRLDWMIWFVPPQSELMMGWFNRFIWQLARNEPKVTALLRKNPFEGKPPPRLLRVLVYRYRFTNWEERKETGNWWVREYKGVFPYVAPRNP
jgi:hypothetical protein